MLNPFAKAIAYYLIGGFGLALLCIPAFIRPGGSSDPGWGARTRRRSWALAAVGPLHPVLALTSLGLATEAEHAAEGVAPARDSKLRLACWTSIVVSAVIATAVLLVTRR